MPTNRTPLQRPNRIPLTHETEMSLRYGDLPSRPAFSGEEERRAAWFAHRDMLLRHCRGGQRPAGWWDYESPFPYPGRDSAAAALFEAGLLTAGEVAELTARWREDFERAQDPRFTFRTASTWLDGAAARRAHYRWSGIPRDLLKRWTRERRRRGRTIRQLKAAAGDPAPVT
jgi:hypothetical protein